MSSAKHEKTFVDYDMPYEPNTIGLRGVVYFGVGLLLLIVITFALMWALYVVFEDNAKIEKKSTNPMAQSDKDRLPPEPRLQVAPGFGVESPHGWVNLELKAPQSEWWEIEKQNKELWKNGIKDEKTGAVSALPIEVAKAKLLERNVKARSGPEAEHLFADSKLRFTDASAGRVAADRKR